MQVFDHDIMVGVAIDIIDKILVLIYFVKNILPYLGIAFGYFLVIFIPIRVMQAKERNRQELNNRINEQKLQEHTDNEKELQKKILEALTKEETI